jgi:hypothetical protein
MRYVVVIEKDDGTKDYKVFSKSADAIRRHDTASYYVNSGDPISVSGQDETCLAACSMFKVATDDAREAVRLVVAGSAEPLVPKEFYADRGPTLDEL